MNDTETIKEDNTQYYQMSAGTVHHTYNLNKSFAFKDVVNIDVSKNGEVIGIEIIKTS